MITLDEEDNIGDCLGSADFADELIVVDSHSSDRTREIAAGLGARVVERDWPGHIEQKNFALEQARNDWVLCLDADERVTPELRASILEALRAPGDAVGFEMNRRTWYHGRWIRHGGWYPDRKLRLFRRSTGGWGGTNPHDHVYVDGPRRRLDGDLLHYSYRSIADHLATINSFTTIMAREKAAAGKRSHFAKLLLVGPWKFVDMYILKRGFLDGVAGFIVAVMGAYYVFLKYAKLAELTSATHESAAAESSPDAAPGTEGNR